jgi:branched-chain amino acid aminotransferase
MMPPIDITRTTSPKPRVSEEALGFGQVFTDHMFLVDYGDVDGWHSPRIVPYQPLAMDPASAVLHYAQAVFDGLKAYRGQDGSLRLFRPGDHAARLNRSCAGLCIPPLDEAMIEASFHALVDVDRDWVPSRPGTSLYLRPAVIATERFLGVRPAKAYTYFLIASPVGSYYGEGIDPVSILVAERHVRAVEGGLGAFKAGANYAASLYAAEEAKREGFSQVLWLDGVRHRYLDEVGTMNIMLRIGDEVITPPLSGTILAGITRDTVITLLRDWGMIVSERPIPIDEVIAAVRNGTLTEMWGTGTAAVVSPVGELGYKSERLTIANGQIGPLTHRLFDAITGLQYGTVPDPHGWIKPVRAGFRA